MSNGAKTVNSPQNTLFGFNEAELTALLGSLDIAFHLFGVDNSKVSDSLTKSVTFINISLNIDISCTSMSTG
jgi:hypothetical protein